jgi:hypothetical protein
MKHLALALPLLVVCAGCAPRAMLIVDALIVGNALAHASDALPPPPASDDDDLEGWIEVVHPEQAGPVDMQPSTHSPPPSASFDLGAAYAGIAAVDLASCKPAGLAAGYGRIMLRFAADGRVTGLVFRMPPSSSPAAHACVQAAFREVEVPAFTDVGPRTVQHDFYVR